jgi:hypothetical protein
MGSLCYVIQLYVYTNVVSSLGAGVPPVGTDEQKSQGCLIKSCQREVAI